MKKLTKEEILLAFPEKIRKKIKLPSLEEINWGNLDFLGWIHPSGNLGYIVYSSECELRGLVLNRTITKTAKGIRMCSLCLTLRISGEVSLFSTIKMYNKKISFGNYICADLQCSHYVRGELSGVAQMSETITAEKKITRLQKNVKKLFISVERFLKKKEEKQ